MSRLTRTTIWLRFCVGLAVGLLVTIGGRAAMAEEYVLDEDESFVDIKIDQGGFESFPQEDDPYDSDRLFFEGSIIADRTSGIDIDPDSTIDALLYDDGNTNLEPGVGGTGSAVPADAGVWIEQFGFADIGNAALRGIRALVDSGGNISVNGNGEFDAVGIELELLADSFVDYDLDPVILDPVSGREDLEGEIGVNDPNDPGVLTMTGVDEEELFLPIDIVITFDVDGNDVDLEVFGQLVGYADLSSPLMTVAVPEPGSFVLLTLGLATMLPLARRHLRGRTRNG